MKEDFLHFLWYTQNFAKSQLLTSDGEEIKIIHVGTWNRDAGPDFLNAQLQIGSINWVGNVEIHIQSSDWFRHKHQFDNAYNNVILHVVLENDKPAISNNGLTLHTLELKDRIPNGIKSKYKDLMENQFWIPCQNQVHQIDPVLLKITLEEKLIERLERKTESIKPFLELDSQNWEEVFYQFLARSFGYRVNAEPFFLLARNCPLSLIKKHKNSLLQIQALLFGQAGYLNKSFTDEFPNLLQKEYNFLQKKYKLEAINIDHWKLLRLRPANFPEIRIAQFAHLLFQSNSLFSKAMAAANVKEYENMFELKISDYWDTHYRLDFLSPKRKKSLGKSKIHSILINTVVPFLFLYGQYRHEQKYIDKALNLLMQIPAEQNYIIRQFIQLDFPVQSAFDSQALLTLKNEYCDHKKCTQCKLGYEILQD